MPKTGATRYQKFLKSEKSKTKLKSKELPRGTNVTKTNFKVKKIVIREQLKTHGEDEAITKKKLNLKELLTRLNHFNTNSRTEGLNGIKELVSEHPEILELHLGQLIQGVTPLVLNIEKIVRRESLKVLHLILSNAPSEKISPFFDVLCTYLRCAMTHIDTRIQEDSLLFLDVLLLCTPNRVAGDFYKIIPNFIDMISKLRVDSKPGRALTINLNSKITSSKWRVKVLHRLQELLDRFVMLNKTSVESTSSKTHYFDENEKQCYPLYSPSIVTNWTLPCFSVKSGQNENASEDEAENFKKYSDTLLPLLFETWLEASPNSHKPGQSIETMLSEEAACLLKHLLEVINLLWRYVNILNYNNHASGISKWFCAKFRKSYNQHIVGSFPFNTVIRSVKDKNSSNAEIFVETITDPKMVIENLKICNLYISMNADVHSKEQTSEIVQVLNYVEKIFSRNKENLNNGAIIEVLNSLFSVKSYVWYKNAAMGTLYEKIVNTYFDQKISRYHQEIFALLCRISLDTNLAQFHKTEAHQKWLTHLPDILCNENVSMTTIDILHKFATQNSKVFNSTVKPKLLDILKNLPTLKIEGNSGKESNFRLLSLLYWINGWDSDCLNLLESQLKENAYGSEQCKFIVDILKLKSQGIFK